MSGLIPIIVAVISIIGILIGYILERRKQREFEINKIRRELYARLIKNFIEKLELFEKIKIEESFPKRITRDELTILYTLIDEKYPELNKNFKEFREIMALMSIYGTDGAIKACVEFARESISSLEKDSVIQPDIGKLMLSLRKTLSPKTEVTSEDINLVISK